MEDSPVMRREKEVIDSETKSIVVFCGIKDELEIKFIRSCISIAYNSGGVDAFAELAKEKED